MTATDGLISRNAAPVFKIPTSWDTFCMPTPQELHRLPNPHSSVAGRNNRDSGENSSIKRQAAKYRPAGTRSEPLVAIVARFAASLIDKKSGQAFSADELLPKCTAAMAQTAYVQNGTTGDPHIGDSTAPFPTIRAALKAFPTGETVPRNIVLINRFIGEQFPFTPLVGDPSFFIEAANKSSRSVYTDLVSTAPAAVIVVPVFESGAFLRISGNHTVGLHLPNLSAFSGIDVVMDIEGLASLTIYGEGVTEGDGPASLFVTARECRNVFVDLIGTLDGANHSNGTVSLILLNCGSNDSAISISGTNGWGYFSDSWVNVTGGTYMVLGLWDSSGGIVASGAGFSQQYSTPLYSDLGGNYDHNFW